MLEMFHNTNVQSVQNLLKNYATLANTLYLHFLTITSIPKFIFHNPWTGSTIIFPQRKNSFSLEKRGRMWEKIYKNLQFWHFIENLCSRSENLKRIMKTFKIHEKSAEERQKFKWHANIGYFRQCFGPGDITSKYSEPVSPISTRGRG